MVVGGVTACESAIAHIYVSDLGHIVVVMVVTVEDGHYVAALRHCGVHSRIVVGRAASLHPRAPERGPLILCGLAHLRQGNVKESQ